VRCFILAVSISPPRPPFPPLFLLLLFLLLSLLTIPYHTLSLSLSHTPSPPPLSNPLSGPRGVHNIQRIRFWVREPGCEFLRRLLREAPICKRAKCSIVLQRSSLSLYPFLPLIPTPSLSQTLLSPLFLTCSFFTLLPIFSLYVSGPGSHERHHSTH
jgi:hypothetical protein